MGIPVGFLPIPGYDDSYFVSKEGEIWSEKSHRILKPVRANNGYAHIELFSRNGGKIFLIHRIVANVFIPNPENKPQVNHIDEDKMNNAVSNLEWVTAKENMSHGTRLQRQKASTDYKSPSRVSAARENGKARRKSVCQFFDGKLMKIYPSAKAAAIENNLNHSHICECANKTRYKHVGGFSWVWRSDLELEE